MPKVTYLRVREALDYSLISGKFYWKIPGARRRAIGTIAGSLNADGYIQIGLDGETLYGHRLAYFWLYGLWPKVTIDHEDRDKANNCWLNLREATYGANNQNTLKKGKHGNPPGVYVDLRRDQIFSKIVVEGKAIRLGTFDTKEEAHKAYKLASLQYFGEFSPFYKLEEPSPGEPDFV